MSSFRETLRRDWERYLDRRPMCLRNAVRVLFRYPGLQAVLVYRVGRFLFCGKRRPWSWLLMLGAGPVYWLATMAIRVCYDIRLHTSAVIGPGLSVLHFGGVEVANCRLGEMCSIIHQTKVGSPTDASGPRVGDGVWIGAHARVSGPIVVGDGATIAPGSRVVKDVPGRALVAGDPARIVFRSYDNAGIQPYG